MRFACWITKATDTHSEYVILLALPRQQWLHERASMLRHTYIACLVYVRLNFIIRMVKSNLGSRRKEDCVLHFPISYWTLNI
jgi:hypothetical protein